MKFPRILFFLLAAAALALPASAGFAQASPTTSASPLAAASTAVTPRPRPPVDSKKPEAPPDQPLTRTPQWEQRALAQIADGQKQAASVQLIFDGDSITDFFQHRAGKDVWSARYGSLHAVDFAISGDWTQHLLWRLSKGQAEGMKPKLIALMIGTNNMQSTSTPEEIAGGVKQIIQTYQQRCPGAVILLQAIFPRAPKPDDPYRLKVDETNKLLFRLGDGKSVVYVDFGAKFLQPDGTLTPDIMPDYLHPSAKGYGIWADAIQPYIDKYVK